MGFLQMETKAQSETNNGEEDYIDMEVSSSSSSASSSSSSSSTSSFINFAVSSPPHSREFEFQMCSSAVGAAGECTTSPADELFYKGKLLPLHLPPRLQMVQKLLETSEEPSTTTTTTTSTPRAISSCAASPCESRRFSSGEVINPDENFFELSCELRNLIENDNPRSTLNKKIKQSLLTKKIKSSRAFIRALFTRPGCSDSEIDPKSKLEGTKYSKTPKKKNPFGRIDSFDEFSSINRGFNNNSSTNNIHRKSFSGVIQRHCPTKCLSYSGSNSSGSSSSSSASSSFSFGSNGSSSDLQILNRSSSASSEIDKAIEGAIAHCKQSFGPRKSNVSDGEPCSSRSSLSGERERAEISRI